MKKENTKIFIFHIMFPILIGGIIYYLISPEVLFVKKMDSLLGTGIHIKTIGTDSFLVKIIRSYLLDMLWGYALVFALFFTFNNNTAELKKIAIVAFSFSVLMETLQLTSFVRGTFDVFDILVEFLAEAAAVVIIKKHFLQEDKT